MRNFLLSYTRGYLILHKYQKIYFANIIVNLNFVPLSSICILNFDISFMSYSYMYLYKFLKILNFHVTQETGDIEIGKVAINLKNHEDCLTAPRIASEFSLDIISQAHGYFKLIHPTLPDAKLKCLL